MIRHPGLVLAAFALLAVLSLQVAPSMRAAEPTRSEALKALMADNFRNVQVMLALLIAADYKDIPPYAGAIREHALHLMKTRPAGVSEADERLFNTYASNLEISTGHLVTIVGVLNKNDQTMTNPGQQNVDYLRAVAAVQYGQIVTTCVACHNQFRRRQVALPK
ncbi:MAG: hypothetical protein HY423_11455 [Candidatus Lambdaproteobacteria bacterium]|nr:hypothetical protein [Candidatus Lambdaproteobacteria bacterium]